MTAAERKSSVQMKPKTLPAARLNVALVDLTSSTLKRQVARDRLGESAEGDVMQEEQNRARCHERIDSRRVLMS